MASLVQFLASGVNGAEDGTATFVLRGTSSSAASVLYSDFEETAQPGTNIITLDSHGAAEIYCDAYCDVTLKTSGGATLRTVTIGHAATMVEVQSDSFTGTDYSGAPTAAGEPITLAAVLDKWDNSAGADDWKVAVNGVATNLSSAFSALAGLFFNVKDPIYGAVGDGTTDDTTAINLAIAAAAAAGGGIVFFPSSTSFYKFTTLTIASANITLMGAGPRASVLKSASTSTILSLSGNATGDWLRVIGLSVTATAANANPLVTVGGGMNVLIDNCEFDGSPLTGTCINKSSGSTKTFINIRSSKITVGANTVSVLRNLQDDGACRFKVTGCNLIVASGFTGTIVRGPDFVVDDCIFDGSLVTSGTCLHVNATSNSTSGKYLGTFTNNIFLDGASTSVAFQLSNLKSDCDFSEANNRFSGFTAPTALSTADTIYNVSHDTHDALKVWLGSRKGRTLEVTQSSATTITMLAFSSYENIFVNYTAAGNSTLKAPIAVMVPGAECTLVLQNNDASQRDIVIDYGETPQTYGPQAATSGSDLTLQPNNGERVVFMMKFMHFGSDAPLAFIPVPVED